jgi:hypothetical protein
MGWMMLRRVLSRSGSQSRGPLRESGDVIVPVTAGLIQPVVILPTGWRKWDSRLRRAVLAHEFEHIRRRDTLVSAFGRAVTSLLWFHPLAWWVVRKISELSEIVCDIAAVKAAENPAAYAQILLDFAARIHRAGHRAALPGLAIAGSSGLERRVDRVLAAPGLPLRRLTRPRTILGLIGAPVLCIAATFGVTGTPQQPGIVAKIPQTSSAPTTIAALPATPSPSPSTAGEQNAPAVRPDMGVIAGRLFIADGSPAPNTGVAAMSGPVERDGAKIWTTVGSIRTDSEGRYRIEVPKGDYTIVSLVLGNFGITDADRTIRVSIAAGQTVDGVNLRLNASAGVRVRGRLVPAPGAEYSSIQVSLESTALTRDGAAVLSFKKRSPFDDIGFFPVQQDGSFEFPVVPQGVYELRVFPAATTNPRPYLIQVQPPTVSQTGFGPLYRIEPGYRIDVGRTDVNGLQVPVRQVPVRLFVTVHVGSDTGHALPAFVVDLLNFKTDGAGLNAARPRNTSDMVLALTAGQHRISFELPFGYYMKTFSYGNTDLLRAPLDLMGSATSDIIATITRTPPAYAAKFVTVRGRVTGLPGSSSKTIVRGPLTAFLFAPESGAYGFVPLQDDGSFEFRNVPPGTYSGYVAVSGGLYPHGKTVVVANTSLDRIELPIDPSIIVDKR